LKGLDSRLRGNDGKVRFLTFYESIKIDIVSRQTFDFDLPGNDRPIPSYVGQEGFVNEVLLP
jgi:hypothetical protein